MFGFRQDLDTVPPFPTPVTGALLFTPFWWGLPSRASRQHPAAHGHGQLRRAQADRSPDKDLTPIAA
jgi:hypothetical protein